MKHIRTLYALSCVALCSCQELLGLDSYAVQGPDAGDAGDTVQQGAVQCVASPGLCGPVLSEDCRATTGPIGDQRALRIGTLLSSSGAQAEIGQRRERSTVLAAEQLNAKANPPIALIHCDATADVSRAARHLVQELGVSAIIGPNGSQDVLDVARTLTIASGVLILSPTAVAASIGDLLDDDLSWTMVPTDAQRAPLLLRQVSQLERQLQRTRGEPLKLSVVLRGDVLGAGTRGALHSLTLNDRPLSDPLNLGSHVQIGEYDPNAALDASVSGLLAFQPDIVLLVGTAETITGLMGPLEAGWPAGRARPHYVLTESSKVPELLQLVAADAALGQRVRGIGVRPPPEAVPVHQAFLDGYRARFGASADDVSGMSQSYDAVYALAYAAAARGDARSGSGLAAGLRSLSTGTTRVSTGSADRERALAAAAQEHALDVTGTLGRLQWNDAGSLQGGMLEVWCVANEGGSATFRSSGSTYDLGTQTLDGDQAGCPQLQAESAPAPAAGMASSDPPQVTPPAMQASSPMDAATPGTDRARDAGMPAEPAGPPAAPVAQDVGLRVQYRCFNDQPRDGSVEPFFRIVNVSAEQAVPLRGLELRYYFTNEQAAQCPAACQIDSYYTGISGQTVNARRSLVVNGGLTYLSITFERSSQLLRGGEYVEAQQQFHTSSYAALDETDDYSFDPSKRDFAEWKKVTLYQNGALVWGAPPL